MKFTPTVHAITLALAMCAISASTGNAFAAVPSPAAQAGPETPQAEAKSYRLTYTITDRDGATNVATQHYSIVVVAGHSTTLKQGSRVPVVTGSYGTSKPADSTQIQYLDIGLNIDATLNATSTGVTVRSKVEQSSVAAQRQGLEAQDPIVRQVMMDCTSILTVGKPLMLGSLDIPEGTHHMDISLLLENLR